jgi:predicted DNA-binding transcriptional regulator AlpA
MNHRMRTSKETISTIDLVNAKHAAMILGVSATTFRKLNMEEKCPKPFKFGNAAKWWRGEFMDWIDAGRPSRKEWETAKKESGTCKTHTKSYPPQSRQPGNAALAATGPGTGRGGNRPTGFGSMGGAWRRGKLSVRKTSAGNGQGGNAGRKIMIANDTIDPAIMEHDDIGAAMLLTAEQAAAFCGMSRSVWYKYLAAGKIPRPVKIGSLARWRKDELAAWIAAGCPSRDKWDAIG